LHVNEAQDKPSSAVAYLKPIKAMPIINVSAACAVNNNNNNDGGDPAAHAALTTNSRNPHPRPWSRQAAAGSPSAGGRPAATGGSPGQPGGIGPSAVALEPKLEGDEEEEDEEEGAAGEEVELDKTFFNWDGVGYSGVVCKEEEWGPRKWIFQTLEDPHFSPFGNVCAIFIVGCIFVSIIAIVIETLPSLRKNNSAGKFFIAVEMFSTIIFTVEYLCKFSTIEPDPEPPEPPEGEEPLDEPAPAEAEEDEEPKEPETICQARCRWMKQTMEIVDLVAIAPFYIELVCNLVGIDASSISILRLLRVVRIFRVFKLSKYSSNIQLCAKVMVDSKDSLGLMVFMLAIVAVVFSSFEFFCEKGTWNDQLGYYIDDHGNRSRFDSIPATMWWCVVTVMTVGYGDLYPITVGGKIVAAGAMVCAIVIMALPISVVGSNFSRAWSERAAADNQKTASQELTQAYQALHSSLADHSNIMEDVLTDVSQLCESLSAHLVEAHKEYTMQQRLGRGQGQPVADGKESKLNAIVKKVISDQSKLEDAISQLSLAQDPLFEVEVERSLSQATEMSQLMLQHHELGANVVGLEAVVFSRSLS